MTGDVAALVPATVRIDDKTLPLGTRVGETEKRSKAGHQGGMHVAFPVLTETARSYTLTDATIPPGTVAPPGKPPRWASIGRSTSST